MDKTINEISILKNQITNLIELFEDQKSENSKLLMEITSLKNYVKEKDYLISEHIQKYETLKIAKTITASSKDSHDAKIKINQLVREIDKCIGLLNK